MARTIAVRPAEPRDDDAVARLLYSTATGRYDLFAGNLARSLRLLAVSIGRAGNDTSREGVLVAEVDGEVAGAIASFPSDESQRRRRRFVRMALVRRPPWRWPLIVRVARSGERIVPEAPADSLYIDALATDERFRRRGVATTLLDTAAERARALGLSKLALDTAASNAPARALYEGAGFELAAEVPAQAGIPAIVFYVREVA